MAWFNSKKNKPLINKQDFNNKYLQALYHWGLNFTQYDANNENYLTKGYNYNPDVYSVIKQKATEVNRIPYFVKKVKDEQQKQKYLQLKTMVKDAFTPHLNIKRTKLETKAFDNEEMLLPLDKPNRHQSWSNFFALYETYIDTTGNFFIYILSPDDGLNKGEPNELYILPSQYTQIVLKSKTDMFSSQDLIDYYITTIGDVTIKFNPESIVHIKLPNPNFDLSGSHLYGQSPLKAALRNIQSSNEALSLNAKTLANGGAFGFLSTKEPLTSDTQGKQIKERLVEMDNSPKRLSNLAGASQEIVFTRISLTTDELKPFDYLEFDQKTICNVLGWDDKLLNSDDGAKYDNYKTALRRAITSGVSPNLRLLEEAFNTDILPRFKKYQNTVLIFDESQLPEMQEDMEKLSKWLNDSLDRGVINRNEYREAINYPILEGVNEMDIHTVSMNVIPLEDAIMPAEDISFEQPIDDED